MKRTFNNRVGISVSEIFTHIQKNEPENLREYMRFYNPLEENGKYLYYDKLQFKALPPLNPELAWLMKKLSRVGQAKPINGVPADLNGNVAKVFLTPTIQKGMHDVDRYASAYALESMLTKIGEETHLKYLLNDLIQDESISSSQLEGAATTTVVAKEMISRNRQPRSLDERMVLGNFRLMNCAWEHRNKPLSLELIKELHEEGVKDINDANYGPGQFRQSNDVVITDYHNEIIHQPPDFNLIDSRLQTICDWINNVDANQDTTDFLHPLVKAITLHFFIGYEHPFKDGNGRVARALFYWFLFKNEYSVFRYISISVLLKKAPRQYANSYTYTENDEFDLTYFIDYQCAIIIRAIKYIRNEYLKAFDEIEKFNTWLWNSDLYSRLTPNQRTVFQVAKTGRKNLTIREVQNGLACSYNTAATVLNGLVKLKIFQKEKHGKEWIYCMVDGEVLVKNWN